MIGSPLSPRRRLWFDWRGSQLWRGLRGRSGRCDLFAFPLRSLVYSAPTRFGRLRGSLFGRRGKRELRQRWCFVLGCPIRCILASHTVFGLHTHKFGNLILEGSPLVSELPNLVQKDPDLASESFREIVDIFWRCTTRIVGTSLNFV